MPPLLWTDVVQPAPWTVGSYEGRAWGGEPLGGRVRPLYILTAVLVLESVAFAAIAALRILFGYLSSSTPLKRKAGPAVVRWASSLAVWSRRLVVVGFAWALKLHGARRGLDPRGAPGLYRPTRPAVPSPCANPEVRRS